MPWTPIPDMGDARFLPGVALMGNGKLVVAGGGDGTPNDAEYFNGAVWVPLTNLPFTGTLQPYYGLTLGSGDALIIDGNGHAARLDQALLTWGQHNCTYEHSRGVAVVLSNGNAAIISGGGSGGTFEKHAEVFDQGSNTWSAPSSVVLSRVAFAGARLAGSNKVVICGGNILASPFATAATEISTDAVLSGWTTVAPMSTARYYHAAIALANGKLLVVGGYDVGATLLASCEIYDPVGDTWTPAASLPVPREMDATGLTLLPDGRVLLCGGYESASGGTFKSALIYDPNADTWTATDDMSHRRGSHGQILYSSSPVKVMVVGGEDWTFGGADFNTPAAEFWTPSPPPTSYNIPSRAEAALDRDLLGVDLLFTDDLQVTANGDWQTVDRFENLRRAIYRRLFVKPGEFRLRPDYGVGVGLYVKRASTKSARDELKQRITTQLLREKRISRVVEVDVSPAIFNGDTGLRIRITVEVTGQILRFKPFNFAQEK